MGFEQNDLGFVEWSQKHSRSYMGLRSRIWLKKPVGEYLHLTFFLRIFGYGGSCWELPSVVHDDSTAS